MAQDTLQQISEEYYSLNGSHYDILDELPSALEFSRLVRIARPVLMRASTMPSESRDPTTWTKDWITKEMGDREISVAVTPHGRADAVVRGPDNKLYFAEPCTQSMAMRPFLDTLSSGDSSRDVHYLQSQNGNLFTSRHFDGSGEEDSSEFTPLRGHIPSEIAWCSDALGKSPDAVNLWIGDDRSVTSIHSDPYENIYSVVRGTKHFTLLPPTEGWCMNERLYPHATYQRSPGTSVLELVPSEPSVPPVRWSSVANPNVRGALPPGAHPINISVRAGETLYLPAGWWHFVEQEGFTVAVNHWYDMEERGMGWVWLEFLRGGKAELPLANSAIEGEDGAKGGV